MASFLSHTSAGGHRVGSGGGEDERKVPVRNLAGRPWGGTIRECFHAFLLPEVKTGEWNRVWGLNMEELLLDMVLSKEQALFWAAQHKH